MCKVVQVLTGWTKTYIRKSVMFVNIRLIGQEYPTYVYCNTVMYIVHRYIFIMGGKDIVD